MKKTLSILTLLFTIVLSANLYVSAQNNSLVVKSKKTTYKRTGAKVDDSDKEFIVNYPQISRRGKSAVKKKIEDTVNYWTVFDTTLEENMAIIRGSKIWIIRSNTTRTVFSRSL